MHTEAQAPTWLLPSPGGGDVSVTYLAALEHYLATLCTSQTTPTIFPLPNPGLAHPPAMAQSDDEDDYMNMVFDDAPSRLVETSLQRAARKRKEVLPRPTLNAASPNLTARARLDLATNQRPNERQKRKLRERKPWPPHCQRPTKDSR